MSVRRMSRSRRSGFLPAVDGLEARLVLATAPTNVLAIPAQVAQLNAQVLGISNAVISAVPFTLALGGHLNAQGVQNVTKTYAMAQADFAQLTADRDAVQQAVDDQLSTLREGKFLLDQQITQNNTDSLTFIANYYNSLTPDQQAAQFSAIAANVTKVNQATASALKTSHDFYTNKENAVISLYNSQVGAINTALANGANAVRLSGNLFVYVVQGSTVPIAAPIYTPLQLIKPRSSERASTSNDSVAGIPRPERSGGRRFR